MRPVKLVIIVASLLMASCSEAPAEVGSITLINETGYELDVHVSDGAGTSALPLGVLEARSERSVERVNDQGDTWTFRFIHWGDTIAELTLDREELEGNDWTVEVPEEVEQELQTLGRPPAP
ncbi:MAG: hypothetical protein ACRDH9_01550 [Actinomycetota bacterium]